MFLKCTLYGHHVHIKGILHPLSGIKYIERVSNDMLTTINFVIGCGYL